MALIWKLIAVAAFLPILMSACGGTSESSGSGYRHADDASSESEFDEDTARDRAVDDLSYESYSSIGQPYGCTDDCSGHDAGFEWAKQAGVTDGSCYSDSASFNEGCQAYADAIEEKIDEYRDTDESNW
jgi:cellulase/cellobiase CelA1